LIPIPLLLLTQLCQVHINTSEMLLSGPGCANVSDNVGKLIAAESSGLSGLVSIKKWPWRGN